jgi:hypothetical protein
MFDKKELSCFPEGPDSFGSDGRALQHLSAKRAKLLKLACDGSQQKTVVIVM